ncbi:hypothetical protein DFP72DRAFT_1046286 [Ephemerocybe angulata]|uniref:Uncharacterized protein n=1 Tax=Ephemerocybe angulata TaxID=980116 RepID=A0A8H6HXE6_9AGAR|nr:hypothetical protein DFP72DRAFT_1046286 [Tulosesus angulatus]
MRALWRQCTGSRLRGYVGVVCVIRSAFHLRGLAEHGLSMPIPRSTSNDAFAPISLQRLAPKKYDGSPIWRCHFADKSQGFARRVKALTRACHRISKRARPTSPSLSISLTTTSLLWPCPDSTEPSSSPPWPSFHPGGLCLLSELGAIQGLYCIELSNIKATHDRRGIARNTRRRRAIHRTPHVLPTCHLHTEGRSVRNGAPDTRSARCAYIQRHLQVRSEHLASAPTKAEGHLKLHRADDLERVQMRPGVLFRAFQAMTLALNRGMKATPRQDGVA